MFREAYDIAGIQTIDLGEVISISVSRVSKEYYCGCANVLGLKKFQRLDFDL